MKTVCELVSYIDLNVVAWKYIFVYMAVLLLSCADLYLTTSTQVQLVPGFLFAGQRPRYSITPNSAASRTSGHLVSKTVQQDIFVIYYYYYYYYYY